MDLLTAAEHARALDAGDELAVFRDEFLDGDPNRIYLCGAAHGRIPRRSAERVRLALEHGWGQYGLQSLSTDLGEAAGRAAAKLAALIGAPPDEVVIAESAAASLFLLAAAALQMQPRRRVLVSDELNRPASLSVLQNMVGLLAGEYRLALARSMDGISMANAALPALMDNATAAVCLAHVAPASAFMYSMERITAAAHAAGALMLWDLSHSAAAMPLDMNGLGVDLAFGRIDTYLNGGPGAPAFIYVRRDLQSWLPQPLQGWFAGGETVEPGLPPDPMGVPPALSTLAIEPGLDLLLEAGLERLRAKSVTMSEYIVTLAETWLVPLGFTLASPHQPELRGAHISLRHPEAHRIFRALASGDTSGVQVMLDFYPPDILRIGPSPLYTRYEDICRAMELLRQVAVSKYYEHFSNGNQATGQ